MPRQIKKDSTDISLYFFMQDSSDGSPETGITITDLDLQYVRFGAAPSAKVDATALAATDSAHADNKAIEIDGTDQPGLYRVDWPDAAFATGVDGVILTVKGTGFQPAHMEIQLVDYDPTDSVRLGLTSLPPAAAEAAGGLFTRGTGTGQINQDNNGEIDVDVQKWLGTAAATPTVAGVPEVDLTHLMGTILTEGGAGRLAAAFIKLFDVASPLLVASDVMRGTDSAATAAKLLAYVRLLARSDAAVETDAAAELTAINADEGAGAGDFSSQTDSEEAIRDRGDSAWPTATGFNTTVPDAAGVAPTATEIVDEWETQSQADPTGFHVNVKEVNGTAQTANDNGADINTLITNVGSPANIDSGGATLADNLKKIADDNGGATFDATNDSLNVIRDQVDAVPTASEIQTEMEENGASLLDTIRDQIGTAGAGLTDLGGMSTGMKAEVQTEANDAIEANDLDHLIQVTAGVEEPTDGSYLDQIMHKSGSQTFDPTTDSLEAIRDTAPLGTAMRGTDNAALASVLGALADAAAAGDPTTADTVMQYIKQLINILIGTAGITTFPAAAAPANAVSLAEVIRAIYDDTNELETDITDGGRVDLLIDAIKAQTDDLADGQRLDLLIDGIKAQTDDLADGQRLDLLIDAIKAKTDNLKDSWNDPTSAAIATAVMAKVVDGTIDITEALTIMVAVLAGDMAKSSNTYTYKDQSDVTKVTAVVSDSAVARTIA